MLENRKKNRKKTHSYQTMKKQLRNNPTQRLQVIEKTKPVAKKQIFVTGELDNTNVLLENTVVITAKKWENLHGHESRKTR